MNSYCHHKYNALQLHGTTPHENYLSFFIRGEQHLQICFLGLGFLFNVGKLVYDNLRDLPDYLTLDKPISFVVNVIETLGTDRGILVNTLKSRYELRVRV